MAAAIACEEESILLLKKKKPKTKEKFRYKISCTNFTNDDIRFCIIFVKREKKRPVEVLKFRHKFEKKKELYFWV